MKAKNILVNSLERTLSEGEFTSKTQILMISIKSLIPTKGGNVLDKKRYFEEIKFWQYYKKRDEWKNTFAVKESNYFDKLDEAIFERLIPITLANKDIKIAYSEWVQNILLTTANPYEILENILLQSYIFLRLKGEEDINDILKEIIMKFNVREFLKEYKSYMRFNIPFEKKFTILFERAKVDFLSPLNGIIGSKYKLFTDMVLKKKIEYFFKNPKTNNEYFYSLVEYIEKLRENEIERENLEIKTYKMPDLFNYSVGDKVFHSLLNEVEIVDKDSMDGYQMVRVKSKSGLYKLVRKI